jgi:hypothetical protein
MATQTVLFINNGVIFVDGNVYDYNDGIYNNALNNETFIRWSGQKKIE